MNSGNKILLPDLPADIPPCIEKIIDAPVDGAITKVQAFQLIGELHKNDVAKTQCGKRLIKIYEEKRKGA